MPLSLRELNQTSSAIFSLFSNQLSDFMVLDSRTKKTPCNYATTDFIANIFTNLGAERERSWPGV
jgi:hypothetical protein